MEFPPQNIPVDELKSELLTNKGVRLFVLRLDKIHPVVSGNKLFKLHYFLDSALKNQHDTIVTYGGAYSNHLVATAYACKESDLKSIGIVRGEAAPSLSPTLQQCINLNMELRYVSREKYRSISRHYQVSPNETHIPEGGYAPQGAAGAALIMNHVFPLEASHIITATGTATTLAGLLLKAGNVQKVVAVPVLKGFEDIEERLQLLNGKSRYSNLDVLEAYHFGGYAKKTPALITFMNELYLQHLLPTDFVYTAKMMYAIYDQLQQGYFAEGSRIVALHTGGLQGNRSLAPGTLIF